MADHQPDLYVIFKDITGLSIIHISKSRQSWHIQVWMFLITSMDEEPRELPNVHQPAHFVCLGSTLLWPKICCSMIIWRSKRILYRQSVKAHGPLAFKELCGNDRNKSDGAIISDWCFAWDLHQITSAYLCLEFSNFMHSLQGKWA